MRGAGEPRFYSDLPPQTDSRAAKVIHTVARGPLPESLRRRWSVQHPAERALLTKHLVDEIQWRRATGKYTRAAVSQNEETTMTEETCPPPPSPFQPSRVPLKQVLHLAPGFCHKGAEPRQTEVRRGDKGGKSTAADTMLITPKTLRRSRRFLMQQTARQLL